MFLKFLVFLINIFLLSENVIANSFDLNTADNKTIHKKYCNISENDSVICSVFYGSSDEEIKNCNLRRIPNFCTCLETGNRSCIRFKNYSKEDDKLIDEYKKKIQNEKEKKEKLEKEKAANKKIKNTQYIKCLMENIKVNSTVSHKEVIELFCKNEVYN